MPKKHYQNNVTNGREKLSAHQKSKNSSKKKKAEQYTTENALKGWFKIQIIGQATYQNDVTQFPVKLPNVSVDPLSKDQYKVYADVSQTIYDGEISKSKKIGFGSIRNSKPTIDGRFR